MILADATKARARRIDPDHGPLVTLRCTSPGCGRQATFTATAPARHIDRRCLVKLRPAGINRDEVKCEGCSRRLHFFAYASRPERSQYLFRCNNGDCTRFRRRQWFVLKQGRLYRASHQVIAADSIAARRAGRIDTPFARACPECRQPRIVHQWKSKKIGAAYRATCRRCQKSTVYDRHGRRGDVLGGTVLKLVFARPRCRCGRAKVIGGRRFKHRELGDLITFVCSSCPWTASRELRTSNGRLVTSDEMRLVTTRIRWRAKGLGFDRSKIECELCRRPMQYGGRLQRVGRDRQPHVFSCDAGHRRIVSLRDDRGRPVIVERGIKRFPWGQRPLCPDCQGPLRSEGEWQGEDGRPLFGLRCFNRACATTLLHYDRHGALMKSPRRIFRRHRPQPMPLSPGAKRWCHGCGVRPVDVPEDRRHKFCQECLQLDPKERWKRAQARRYGESWTTIRVHLVNGTGVARLREQHRLTQVQLAARAGISVPLVKKIEQGTIPITKRTKEKLAHTFAALRPGAPRLVGRPSLVSAPA